MSEDKTNEQATPVITPNRNTLPIELDVRINSLKPAGSIRAIASVGINGCLVIRNISVVEGANGLFVSMPSYKSLSSGKYREYCYPLTNEFRVQLNGAVLGAYQQFLDQSR